ncbi:MAG: GNAT family N-acetyltransferase [Candidatus Gastranaerophilales bacterium]|nr:GNAT family N-acetyltransferase [Candidatus Gastranaerophilales bacterium]
MIGIKQEDDGKKGRFVISENNEMAGEMTYTWAGKEKFIIDHTSVDEKFSGKGFAKTLVQAGVDYARKNEVKIIPLCPYAKRRFDQDESIRDVLA